MWFIPRLRVRHLSARKHARRSCVKQRTFRPRLEAIEPRVVLSTLTVINTLDSGPGSLRAAIAAAGSGDTVDVSNLSGQTIDLTGGELVLNKSLTIQGPSAPNSPVTIDGVSSRVFEVDGSKTNVTLNSLDLIGSIGSADNPASAGAADGQGGAIWNGGTLTLTACNLSGNQSATQGGAIWNGGTLTLTACNLSSNSCYGDALDSVALGGGIFNAYTATATVTGSSLTDNVAGQGGGVYNDGTMTLSGSTVSGNVAGNGGLGGGIFNDQKGRLTIQSKSSITNNYPSDLYNLGQVKVSKDSSVGVIVK